MYRLESINYSETQYIVFKINYDYWQITYSNIQLIAMRYDTRIKSIDDTKTWHVFFRIGMSIGKL